MRHFCSKTPAMKTLILIFFTTSLFASSWKEEYFPKLNFRVSEERLKAIPPFAGKLAQMAEMVMKNPGASEEDGLVLIYDALMLMNNNRAVKEGVLSLKDLRSYKSYTSLNDEEELKMRAQVATLELEKAKVLRSNDLRIPSWIAGSRRTYTDTSLREALDAIPLRPTFNLWTAILMFHTQSADTEMFGELALAGKHFVDSLSHSDNPCATKPEDCRSGPKAPYNLQSSLVTLSDTFTRRAEVLLLRGEFREAMEYLSYAQGTLKQLPLESDWGDQEVVEERADYIQEMLRVKKPRSLLLHETPNFKRAYECSSCHGR